MGYLSLKIGSREIFTEQSIPVLYLIAIIIVNYFAINGYSSLLYLSTIATILLPFIFVFLDDSKISKFHLYLLFIVTVFLSFTIYANFRASYSFVIPYIFVTSFIIVDRYKLDIAALLKIHNVVFLVYLFLSVLVYTGFINLNRDLNIFEEQNFLVNFQTFIGFYGSTASIDSYAMFTAIVNVLFGKDIKEKIIIATLAFFASLSTLRMTPILALILSFIIYLIVVRLVKRGFSFKVLVGFINFFIVFSFLIVLIIEPYMSDEFDFFLQAFTHGRFSIWQNMISNFTTDDFNLFQQLFGIGERIRVDTGWISQGSNFTTNSHNSFIDILIKFGILGLVFFYAGVSYLIANYRDETYYFVVLFILFVATTNSSTFSYSFPIYIFWIYTLYRNPKRSVIIPKNWTIG